MNSQSKEVALDQASAGMELACDLVDERGTVLLQQGSVLSATMLAALARRGVERLRVLGDQDQGPEDAAAAEARRARAEERLAHLFRHGATGPAAELRAGLHDYRLEAS